MSTAPIRSGVLVLLSLLSLHLPLAGQTAPDATEIMEKVDRGARGWGDMEAELRMEIHEGDDVRLRVLDVRLMESGDGDRTLLVLKEPRDLAGTAFLSIRRGDGGRAGWMYLPSRRRARRIGDARASDAFLGSHLTYADLDPPSLVGYDFRSVTRETIDGADGVVVERTRSGEDGGPRELIWVDTRDFRVHRVEFYGTDGSLERTLEVEEYDSVSGFSRPTRLVMRQAEGGGRTVLTWHDVRIGVGLTEADFDPGRLGG
jgi:outer membrane lipoprotein-sorting protein